MLTLTLFDPIGFRGRAHRGGAHHLVQIAPDARRRLAICLARCLMAPGLCRSTPTGLCRVKRCTTRSMSRSWRRRLPANVQSPQHVPPVCLAIDCAGCGTARSGLVSRRPAQPHRPLGRRRPHRGDLIAAARSVGLDFLFLTDHNTTSGLPFMNSAPRSGFAYGGWD